MRVNGLTLTYEGGVNTVLGHPDISYPVGNLLCRIFQGETLYNISRIVRNSIGMCPMWDNALTQDEIEEAERYILETLLYDDFFPAQRLAQGSIIRCMEEYRSLDRATAAGLLTQEKQRPVSFDWLFDDIGFETVGEFLRLCYNNYIIDLTNGIDLFAATSAVWSGTATDEEQVCYDELCAALHDSSLVPGIVMQTSYDATSSTFEHSFVISSFLAMAVFEFSHMAESATKVMRCQNPECRRFFTAKRSSAKYCNYPAPQCPGRTCNDYYPQIVYREKVRTSELDKLIKNAKGRLYNARRRHPDWADEINKKLSDLTIYAPIKRDSVLDGTMTMNEFREWLDSH
ncbi:DUF6076 domain-containing protein [Acutalibacter sp. 1XD8-36]|uniref:DUF6076 domain-containing protein n=1 Tax=Acutalibacter sp. 1XD8-36 TaxID=2320852 RepID=UPI0014131DD2|nr:DUF6076 domain-containing protein [Acutalibacter sp. 1XD8-36]NBJ90758.1 hypothetical protein [Acutalibacter sp. 1XD8-36]